MFQFKNQNNTILFTRDGEESSFTIAGRVKSWLWPSELDKTEVFNMLAAAPDLLEAAKNIMHLYGDADAHRGVLMPTEAC